MNILTAIYTGQASLVKAHQRAAERAERISKFGQDEESQERFAEDVMGMELDKTEAKASARAVKVSSEITNALFDEHMKK